MSKRERGNWGTRGNDDHMLRKVTTIVACIIPWCLATAGLGLIALQRFPLDGTAMFDVPFDGRNAWMDPFLPAERVTSPGAQEGDWRGQRILQDPVYSSARIPGVYDEVEITMEFRPVRQPLIELGLVQNLDAGEIAFSPLWFEPLQDPSWKVIPGEGFHQPGATMNDTRTSALWHASSTMPALSDAEDGIHTTRVTLRGSFDLYAVPAGGRVFVKLEAQDVNRSSGRDTVLFRLYRGSEEIGTEALGIGGSRDEGMGLVAEKTIEIRDAAPGVYRIQVVADDDVFIRSIATNAQRWVLGPRLVFGDDVGFEPTTRPGAAWSDSRHLVLETFHHEGLQTVTFGSDAVALTDTHETYRLDRSDALARPQRLDVPNGDVRIIGDGWFAFSPDAWFAPQPRRITDASDPLNEGVTAVRTPYVRPVALGDGWYRGNATFPLTPDQDRVRLALSAPGLLTRAGAVDIRRVRLTYRRAPLSWNEWWRVLREEARNALRRLR